MGFAILAFCAVFLLFASGGVLLFYREVMLKRISEAITPQREQKTLISSIKKTGFSIGHIVERFEQMMPKSDQEVSVMLQRLTRAGFRGEHAVKIFYGCKVLTPLLLSALAMVTGLANLGPFFVYLMTLGGGFLAPDFWLGKKIEARQKRLERGLPDVLDLLVICMEAGLSLDQATARCAQELRSSQPDLCEELGLVVLEQRAGAVPEAWKKRCQSARASIVYATWFRCWCRRNNLERASPRCSVFTPTRCERSACRRSRSWQRRLR